MKMWRKSDPFKDYSVQEYRKILRQLCGDNGRIKWERFEAFAKASIKARVSPSEFTLSERTFLYGHQNSLQTLVCEGFFDSIQVQPIANDEPLLAFKKYGQDEPFVVFWKGKPQNDEWNKRIKKDAMEIPLKLFWAKEMRFNQPLPRATKKSLEKLGILSENRGGGDLQRDDDLEKIVVKIVRDWLIKHDDLPSAAQVSEELPEEYLNLETAHINRYLRRAIPKAIQKILSSRMVGQPK